MWKAGNARRNTKHYWQSNRHNTTTFVITDTTKNISQAHYSFVTYTLAQLSKV